jgi:hypothetical protein
MGKRAQFQDHVDPEYRRWAKDYPRFPGVGECVRLICAHKAKGSWADIIAHELADNAVECSPELISAYRNATTDDVRLYVMMALDIARAPETVPFLSNVLLEGDANDAAYAERTLRGIGTREARSALWDAKHA